MFKRILVPLDGSERAESALPLAARIARASGGSILLVQVVTMPVMYETTAAVTYSADVIEQEISETELYLKTLTQRETMKGISTEVSALFGAAAQTILSVATAYNIDLIVMTSQGKTGMKRWVLGSVAQKVARHSTMPVLVLHEAGAAPGGERPDQRVVRALVTLDGSVLAKSALEPAAQLLMALAAPGQGALHLLRVVKSPHLDDRRLIPEQIEAIKSQALHKAKTYMSSVVRHLQEGELKELNLSITWSVALDDDIAGTIIATAEGGEDATGVGMPGRCDFISMATHGRTGFQRWALGSVTERVLGATRQPILIVRPAEGEFQQAVNSSAFSDPEPVVKH